MKFPTILKNMKLNSVDFVKRGANPEAHIMLHKSADDIPEEIDVAKAEDVLTTFTGVLGESFSSIMKDDSLTDEERVLMVAKSLTEFNDTVGDYMSSLSILEKSNPGDPGDHQTAETKKSFRKGEHTIMAKFENVDKSLLSPEEAAFLDAIMKKANATETDEAEPAEPGKKVDPAAAKEEAEKAGELPPEVKKALAEVETLKKSAEMKELENVAKKYEILGKKANEEAQTLYNLRKSGEANYNAYIAALDAQVDLVEKSGLFSEIGKSGGRGFSSVAKSEPEAKIESIAKGYMEKDPELNYNDALAKAWEQNPDLMAAYDEQY